MTAKTHCYLFALEIDPMHVGNVYYDLPLHCTLMHRFWSDLDAEELADKVRTFFATSSPVVLTAQERLKLGPKQVAVSEISLTPEIEQVHMSLYRLLNELDVEYTAPEWVGTGYRAHVTERENARLEVGSTRTSTTAYLIEVNVPGYEHNRIVRAKFELKDN